jgi:hypothetical protein
MEGRTFNPIVVFFSGLLASFANRREFQQRNQSGKAGASRRQAKYARRYHAPHKPNAGNGGKTTRQKKWFRRNQMFTLEGLKGVWKLMGAVGIVSMSLRGQGPPEGEKPSERHLTGPGQRSCPSVIINFFRE